MDSTMAVNIKTIESNNHADSTVNQGCELKMVTGPFEIGEDKYYLQKHFPDFEERLRTFEVRDDDVYIAAYPKTGTTWVTEMVWMLLNNCDTEKAKEVLNMRVPLLEYSVVMKEQPVQISGLYDGDSLSYLNKQTGARLIKTHLPWDFLPEHIRNGTREPKIITVVRNPKDVCVSYYHYIKIIGKFNGNLEDFCKLFLAGKVLPGPFWKYMQGCWKQKNRPNVHFVCFKDMKRDLPAEIGRVAKFLGKNITQDQMETLISHLSFESMQKNPAVNHESMMKRYGKEHNQNDFIRAGKEGGHRDVMNPEVIEEFDAWTNGYIAKNEAVMRDILAIM